MSSLAKIARICGVSVGATSKALTGKPGVSEVTRQRILNVAAQQNYRPNRLVHAIQSGRSMTVGLTCNDFQDDFVGSILKGMLEVLYEASYDPIVISWDLCVHEGETVLRTFAERRVDGLLMFPPADQPTHAYLQELKSFQRPIVVVDQVFAGVEDYDFTGSQDYEGGQIATEHLIKLGHKNIANLYHLETSTGRARLDGFRSTMQKHGLIVHEQWMYNIEHYGTKEAYNHAKRLLSEKNGPTAIVAFNDWVALDVLAAARDLNLSVPNDVSVVGFANLRVASSVRPRLTTIAQNPLLIGRRAAKRLLELLDGEKADSPPHHPVTDRIPVKLIIGESTRPIA
ncbi:LacI family DNA-binding transcriptional regulator [Coraliomargarita algicola]|uniref:LacI family DNA-binding transcriptional regulator n=1 Tax=Coraliomargarita algicola TaxID=3092156 RepID=A0ABZ0RGF0_9BACT|nr:LacI family DNA-binding transcriptional regulator [Coraliomargarita sp. J2-16]WPJ95102.1 LacI family DNA-binding transcriptional regulator [Coraliomargarita sp. J2-16]